MTLLAEPAAAAVTPTDLITQVRAARTRREQAERDVLGLAVEWAAAHPVLDPEPYTGVREFPDVPNHAAGESSAQIADDLERVEWRGLPEVAWDAVAPFAAALGLSTRGGRVVLRDALTLAHRLPRVQARLVAELVDPRRARRVAEAVAGQPDDVAAWVDAEIAARIDRHGAIGPVVLDRLLTEALTVLHAEELELQRHEQLTARYATTTTDQPDVFGLAEFVIRGQWPDIAAFDRTLTALADALRHGEGSDATESVDVRRSVAVGILADPARALAVLAGQPTAPTRRQRILLTAHLPSETTPVVTGPDGRTWLEDMVREWTGRDDIQLQLRPVVHCGGCPNCQTDHERRHTRTAYAPTDLDRELLALRLPRCVFPHCTMPAERCDTDHINAHGDGGPTCPHCNLAPLCRHHHRLKTHAGWTYHQVEPGTFEWTEPHGQHFIVTRWGTRDTTHQHAGP